MKLPFPLIQRATATIRALFLVLGATVVPLLLRGSAPAWWSQRAVIVENAVADDYAPANQGQLKNIAKAAVAEMDAKLTSGAGDELHGLVGNWSLPGTGTNDFAPVNLSQLKNVAKPFYDRLIAAGLIDFYPWLSSFNSPDDFAVANIGQVKSLFSFEIPSPNSLNDPLQDRLAPGSSGNLALEANAVWFWGKRFDGNSGFQSTYPRRMTGLAAVRSVSAGDDHFVVLGENGMVWSWGKNASGQLGDGTNLDKSAPAEVPNVSNIVSVKAGGAHTLALQQNGTVLGWGDNYDGQLGTGDNAASSTPISVVGLGDVRKIVAGPTRSAALKNDGSVWTWGYDHYAVQTGQYLSNNAPLQVSGLADIVDIAVGSQHVVAVKADGTVCACGSISLIHVGNGNPWWIYQDIPVQVPKLANVAKVASRFEYTLALLNDGTVWAWGSNNFGQLGDGTSQVRQAPAQVPALTDVIAIATNYQYSLAMKADGTVWTWGDGASGILPGVDRHVPQQVVFGLFDTNHNGMDDRWELQYFGNLNQAGDGDFDGDGISNLQEFLRATDPYDYFNGATPVVEMVSGNNQIGDPGTFLGKPFKVRVRNQAGQLLVNAPVKFTVSNGSGAMAAILSGPRQQSLVLRTDANGESAAYHALPDAAGTSTRTTVSAGNSAASSFVTFRGITKFVLPPTPTPSATPDPNTSPTSTLSPTATPVAPYRYAIIDLGKDLNPIRVNNKGWILLRGSDAQGNWGYYRWKGGTLEHLDYSGPHTEIHAADMNDDGIVVGTFRNDGPWGEDSEREIQGGLIWPVDRSMANKISAPSSFPGFSPRDWYLSYRQAFLTAISNSGNTYGQICTATVRGFLDSNLFVMNSAQWPGGSGSPMQLSNASGTNDDENNLFISHWTGSSDTISRANGAGHYIGRKLTPFAFLYGNFYIYGSESGMIDGQTVNFHPIDLNEAGTVVSSAGADMVV